MNPEHIDLLHEALPYIRKFKGKVFVIKLSGKVVSDRETLKSLASEIALLHQVGFKLVVVHGGGQQVTELADKLGIKQKIVNGRRITDEHTLEITKMVFAGKINTDVTSSLRGVDVPTVGLSGLDGPFIHAKRRDVKRVFDRKNQAEIDIDYGHVGDVIKIEPKLINTLMTEGYVPVICSLGADDKGNIFNINADTIAAEISISLKAEKLILLTDVDGVYLDVNDKTSKISRINSKDAADLVGQGVIKGGMLPKLATITHSLSKGLNCAHIVSAFHKNSLLKEIFTDGGTGTMMTHSTEFPEKNSLEAPPSKGHIPASLQEHRL